MEEALRCGRHLPWSRRFDLWQGMYPKTMENEDMDAYSLHLPPDTQGGGKYEEKLGVNTMQTLCIFSRRCS